MAGFDDILSTIHNGAGATMQDDSGKAIVINSKRMFEIPKDFDTVIGYAGDVNSQIITFQLPLMYDGHDLSRCNNQKIKWRNIGGNTEGISTLNKISAGPDSWTATWEVPVELMSQAGQIQIGISIFDIQDSSLLFSWNTATYSGLSIGEAFSQVGQDLEDEKLPPKDEILNIVTDSRLIVAPAGYRNFVANYGDIGISKVYFSVDKNIHGIDVSDSLSSIAINVLRQGKKFKIIDGITKKNITTNSNKMLLIWELPEVLTNGIDDENNPIFGNFSISITFANSDATKKWTTVTFDNLIIGESLLSTEANPDGAPLNWETQVIEIIDNYFITNEFIIGSSTQQLP